MTLNTDNDTFWSQTAFPSKIWTILLSFYGWTGFVCSLVNSQQQWIVVPYTSISMFGTSFKIKQKSYSILFFLQTEKCLEANDTNQLLERNFKSWTTKNILNSFLTIKISCCCLRCSIFFHTFKKKKKWRKLSHRVQALLLLTDPETWLSRKFWRALPPPHWLCRKQG